MDEIEAQIDRLFAMVPAYWRQFWTRHRKRLSMEVSLVYQPNGSVVDLGGNVGFHAAVCTLMGMRACVVDSYTQTLKISKWADTVHEHEVVRSVMAEIGVQHIDTDILTWQPGPEFSDLSAVCSFDCMEHLHHSPKRLFTLLMDRLLPNGRFVIGVPNGANLLKRIRLLMGRSVYGPLSEWYDEPVFLEHVREPTRADLRVIAASLGLRNVQIIGRNWLGLNKWNNSITRIADHLLRAWPSLCSDLYLLGCK